MSDAGYRPRRRPSKQRSWYARLTGGFLRWSPPYHYQTAEVSQSAVAPPYHGGTTDASAKSTSNNQGSFRGAGACSLHIVGVRLSIPPPYQRVHNTQAARPGAAHHTKPLHHTASRRSALSQTPKQPPDPSGERPGPVAPAPVRRKSALRIQCLHPASNLPAGRLEQAPCARTSLGLPQGFLRAISAALPSRFHHNRANPPRNPCRQRCSPWSRT